MTNTKMREWILERLEKVPMTETFVLFHATVTDFGGSGEAILKRPVKEINDSHSLGSEADAIVMELDLAVKTHIESFEGSRQRYKLEALGDEGEMLAQFPFLQGMKTRDTTVNLSEPANERGLLGQLMRHNESLMRQNTEMAAAVIGPLVDENQALRRQRDGWEEMRLETHLKLESLRSEEHIRKIETDEFERGQDRKDQFWNALMTQWGPEIIKRFSLAGEEALPEKSPDAVEKCQAILRRVFRVVERRPIYESLDQQQQASLDDLLGLGTRPKNEETFRSKMMVLWDALPTEVTESIQNSVAREDPAALVMLASLLGITVEGAKEAVEAVAKAATESA